MAAGPGRVRPLGPRQLGRGVAGFALGRSQLGRRRLRRQLVVGRVERGDLLTGLHLLPDLDEPGGHLAADAEPEVGLVPGAHDAGVRVGRGHLGRGDREDGHRVNVRRLRGRRLLAPGDGRDDRQQGQKGSADTHRGSPSDQGLGEIGVSRGRSAPAG